jgi:hypothetical protein
MKAISLLALTVALLGAPSALASSTSAGGACPIPCGFVCDATSASCDLPCDEPCDLPCAADAVATK